MNRTKIDWGIPGLLTWNPITGCKRGCSYCYARRIHERFNKGPFTDIVYHFDRLKEPGKIKERSVIFVGSMTDHEYWSREYFTGVIQTVQAYSWHEYMFLSKGSYHQQCIDWPKNTMQGLTIDLSRDTFFNSELIGNMVDLPRPFLSIEPLLGNLYGNMISDKFERFIVGAMTGPGAMVPKPEWIQSIRDHVPAEKIYWKPSIRKFL